MHFANPLIEARLLRRYKRFLADIVFPDGSEATAHVANPGAMLGLVEPGSRVLLSRSTNPARKLAFSWEIVEATCGGVTQWIGVDTARPNALVAEALAAGLIEPLRDYRVVRREVPYGKRSRVDFLLEEPGRPPCFVEVKNCHLMREPGFAEFPDCVAARSARHMDELADQVAAGARAVLIHVIQMRAERFGVAADLDPAYAAAWRRARAAGVEVLAYSCTVTPDEVTIARPVPLAE
jgi:sugar fermentation stimulation protein A